MSKCHTWRIEVRVTRVTTNVRSWKYELAHQRKPKSTYKGLWKVGSSIVLLVSIKQPPVVCGRWESKQQAVLGAVCCVFGARCNIVRDVTVSLMLCCPARALGYRIKGCSGLHSLPSSDISESVFCITSGQYAKSKFDWEQETPQTRNIALSAARSLYMGAYTPKHSLGWMHGGSRCLPCPLPEGLRESCFPPF